MRVKLLLGSVVVLFGCSSSSSNGGSPSDASSDSAHANETGMSGDSSSPDDGATANDSSFDSSPTTDGGPTSGRSFPDTTSTIAILADQLPTMNDAQMHFATSHFVGTQKQILPTTQALRALNPKFLVLHYHLAMWQSAPTTDFIVDGKTWGNDYPTLTTHEDWFWHDATGKNRVASNADGKLLMNVSNAAFDDYWASSIATQVADGDYDGVFLDSASPALLQGECSQADARLAGTAAKDTSFSELGGKTWIAAWQSWITALNAALAAKGIPLIPNTSAFTTSWDNTDYGLTAGIFSEGFADPSFAESDWKASTNELLSLSRADKIMILQNYLNGTSDLAKRRYYLANYLLVKGKHTYLEYFADSTLEWYPEWGIDLGAPSAGPASSVDALLAGGVYRRDYEKGVVLVNPSGSSVHVTLGATLQRVVPDGGGAVDASGAPSGSITTTSVTAIDVPPNAAEILLK